MARNVKAMNYQQRYYLTVTKPKRDKARAPKRTKEPQVCAYCGEAGRVGIDHVVPRAVGGGNEASNRRKCCVRCNKSKGKRSLESWRQTLARRLEGAPYFSPAQIAYAKRHGLDIEKRMEEAARTLRFVFEGGDGANVKKAVAKTATRGGQYVRR